MESKNFGLCFSKRIPSIDDALHKLGFTRDILSEAKLFFRQNEVGQPHGSTMLSRDFIEER
jgi:hypothetical protein